MEGGPPSFRTDSTCPYVLRIRTASNSFRLQDSHLLRCTFPCASATVSLTCICPKPRNVFPHYGLASSAFARHYSRNLVDFFSSAYLDVSLRRVPLVNLLIQLTICDSSSQWFPNSEIHGSTLIYSSPWLIAVSHVLLRLLMPRHSPYALFRLNFFVLSCLSSHIIYFTMKKHFHTFYFLVSPIFRYAAKL